MRSYSASWQSLDGGGSLGSNSLVASNLETQTVSSGKSRPLRWKLDLDHGIDRGCDPRTQGQWKKQEWYSLIIHSWWGSRTISSPSDQVLYLLISSVQVIVGDEYQSWEIFQNGRAECKSYCELLRSRWAEPCKVAEDIQWDLKMTVHKAAANECILSRKVSFQSSLEKRRISWVPCAVNSLCLERASSKVSACPQIFRESLD